MIEGEEALHYNAWLDMITVREAAKAILDESSARSMGRVSLVESLELTCLIALKDPRRRSRVSARWLLRYLQAQEMVSSEEAALAASALGALGGPAHEDARECLLAMAESASRRPVSHRVAGV